MQSKPKPSRLIADAKIAFNLETKGSIEQLVPLLKELDLQLQM
jgi:hypothetical protein